MDGFKDIQELLSQPIIRNIADAALQFLQGIAQHSQNDNPGLGLSQQTPRISPAQTGGENPGINPIQMLGSSQPGISTAQTGGENRGINRINMVGSSQPGISTAQTGGQNRGINPIQMLGSSHPGNSTAQTGGQNRGINHIQMLGSSQPGISTAQTGGQNPGMNHFHNMGSSQLTPGLGPEYPTIYDGLGKQYSIIPRSNGSAGVTPRRHSVPADRRKMIFSNIPKKPDFEMNVIGVETVDRTNPRAPTKMEEKILQSKGLGIKQVTFWETDQSTTVDWRIKEVFPIFRSLKGGLKMWAFGGGNSLSLYELGSPIVNGSILKGCSRRIVVSPRREDEQLGLPKTVEMSQIMAQCEHCGKEYDLAILDTHEMECACNVNEDYGAETKLVKKTRYEDESEKYDMPNTRSKSVTRGSCAGNSCTTSSDISPIAGPSGRDLLSSLPKPPTEGYSVADPSSYPSQFSPSTNSDSDVDGIDTLLKHKSEVMFADHSEIFDSDSEFKNELVIRRSHLYEDCIAAVGNKNFIEKIKFPLIITFVGEAGSDYGGLRTDLITRMYDSMEETMELVHVSYISSCENGEDRETKKENYSILYAYGVWCAVGIVQLRICSPFILQWYDAFPDDHPFKEGLSILDVDGLLKRKGIRQLFQAIKLSSTEFENLLEPAEEPAENPFQRFSEERALDEFLSFVRRIEDGRIKGKDSDGNELTVASVYRFITASKIVPRVRKEKLAYKFVLSKKNILTRPEASTCFHNFSIPITSSQNEMDMLWLSALTETDGSYHKT
ncbi:uncharacterized protein LOC124197233 isoform X4 [Daphnia pulex]|uniref:uncharacterized protein LOC124197233 isoform X4 n=1 Tax=Daphnia pulex TaxID=6669 RepID=UPI001EDD33BA|nr:uncharacterized protein LOC124197233 isoform X4 [Daphnia pulex]